MYFPAGLPQPVQLVQAPIVPYHDWRMTPPSLQDQLGCGSCQRGMLGDADPGIASGLKILGVMAFAAGALWIISKGMKRR